MVNKDKRKMGDFGNVFYDLLSRFWAQRDADEST
jgi:hypothetical protein